MNAVRDVLSLATLDAAVEACRPETRGVKRGCDQLCIEYTGRGGRLGTSGSGLRGIDYTEDIVCTVG